LLDLQTSDYGLALTGFDTKDIDDLILNDVADEDAVPPVPANPVRCVGDLWLCGSHRGEVRTWVMPEIRINSLKSLAMNCGPLSDFKLKSVCHPAIPAVNQTCALGRESEKADPSPNTTHSTRS
jgi:hypothetical protein